MEFQFRTFIPATNRIGIPNAVDVICKRHARGEQTTAIVAPPRYGKSDIIRLSAMELVHTGRAAAAICLAPWDQVAGQLVDKKKGKDMLKRHRLTPNEIVTYNAFRLQALSHTFHETSVKTHLFTSTIQLAHNAAYGEGSKLESWVERCVTYGARPVVYIDEAQLLSTANSWGEIASKLIKRGAHVVLLTGTPYRADKDPIPGFSVEEIGRDDDTITIVKRLNEEQNLVELRERVKISQKLVADCEITLKDAWDAKALARIDAMFVGAELVVNGDGQKYIDIPASKQSKYRRQVSTSQEFMREAMECAVNDLRVRRQQRGYENSGMLVITASDYLPDAIESDDQLANFHAREVKRILADIAPDLSASIATSASDDGSKKGLKGKDIINRFVGTDDAEGIGDVLIVKNMGTVGLDAPRLKTIVLMATYRQWAIWMQSILRGATAWNNAGYMTLILLDDAANRANWQTLIVDQGGDYSQTIIGDVLESEIVDVEEPIDKQPEDEVSVTSASLSFSMESHGTSETSADMTSKVYAVMRANPILRERFSVSEVADQIAKGFIVVPEPVISEPDRYEDVFCNVSNDCMALAEEIEDLAKKCATETAPIRIFGNEAWVEAKKGFSIEARNHGGYRNQPRYVTDKAQLERGRDFLRDRLASIRLKGAA